MEGEQSAFPSSLPCPVIRTAGWSRMAACVLRMRPAYGGRGWRGEGDRKQQRGDAGTHSGASNSSPSAAERKDLSTITKPRGSEQDSSGLRVLQSDTSHVHLAELRSGHFQPSSYSKYRPLVVTKAGSDGFKLP